MYEVDFLAVESETGPGSKSGDAIAVRFTNAGSYVVVVIDGGYSSVGDNLVSHIKTHYDATHVDLVISTHPDADHINGLATVLEEMTVGELMIHRPRLHHSDVSEFSNIEAIDELLDLAESNGVTVTEPFEGLTRFNNQLRILGPSVWYYEQLLREYITEVKSGAAASFTAGAPPRILTRAMNLLEKALTYLPIETLTDSSDVSARNNTSVITLLEIEDRRLLFTGDGGVVALEHAANEYETQVGTFDAAPLRFFQAPHHGSKRNLVLQP